jgi:methionyl-tRNA formyltransferase
LLPKFRGPSPVPATILSGDKTTGVTIIKMDEQMDHGPIVFTKEISLSGQEDFIELINKLFQLGGELIVEIIPDFIVGKISLKEQDHEKATYCKMMKKEDGYFDINNPPSPEILDRMIRAYTPWPGVWTKWNLNGKEKMVKFLPRNLMQMEGKKILPRKDFLNGYPNFPLKNLGK